MCTRYQQSFSVFIQKLIFFKHSFQIEYQSQLQRSIPPIRTLSGQIAGTAVQLHPFPVFDRMKSSETTDPIIPPIRFLQNIRHLYGDKQFFLHAFDKVPSSFYGNSDFTGLFIHVHPVKKYPQRVLHFPGSQYVLSRNSIIMDSGFSAIIFDHFDIIFPVDLFCKSGHFDRNTNFTFGIDHIESKRIHHRIFSENQAGIP